MCVGPITHRKTNGNRPLSSIHNYVCTTYHQPWMRMAEVCLRLNFLTKEQSNSVSSSLFTIVRHLDHRKFKLPRKRLQPPPFLHTTAPPTFMDEFHESWRKTVVRTRVDMEHNRIQKLLHSEYRDFSDTVLVESPFAETTREGRGLREVALGLTSTRLVVAADVLKTNPDFTCPPDLDPSIESLELVSVYPLEYVTLTVFRRRRRRTLKARLIDGRAKYYEMGGMVRRNEFWNLWCEKVRGLLARKANGSSLSETSAATSSSASTFYLLASGVEEEEGKIRDRGKRTVCRVWAHYGGAGDGIIPMWPRKDVYLGPSHDELGNGYYTPVPVRFAGASLDDVRRELDGVSWKKSCYSWPAGQNYRSLRKSQREGGLCDVLFTRERDRKSSKPGVPRTQFSRAYDIDEENKENRSMDEIRAYTGAVESYGPRRKSDRCAETGNHCSKSPGNPSSAKPSRRLLANLVPKLSRFGFGVQEKCNSGLYLGPPSGDRVFRRGNAESAYKLLDPYKLVEGGVRIWEGAARGRGRSGKLNRTKHLRRYGLSTAAHFLHALGPWSVQPGERESVQSRRALSAVGVRRQAPDPELRLPVSRRQLTACVSATAMEPGHCGAMGAATRGRVVLFWTPEYWYRPRAATEAYRQLRRHLALLRDFRSDRERAGKRKFFARKTRRSERNEGGGNVEERPSRLLDRIFSTSGGGASCSSKPSRRRRDKQTGGEGGESVARLRRLLKMNLRVTVWDLDSSTIAEQLTLIDRDLFSRVPSLELEILVFQKSTRNAPNLGAWIAFSHRTSCLVASEILAVKRLDMRTRMIARLINAADKCFAMRNFHSCRSILAGLQCPPIYRLAGSWAHLRTHHATRYATMEKLCKIYKSPRTKRYRKAWSRVECEAPFMPYVGDVIVRLLGIDKVDNSNGKSRGTRSRRGIEYRPTVEGKCAESWGAERNGPAPWRKDDEGIVNRTSQEATRNNSYEDPVAPVERKGLARRLLSAAVAKMRYGKTYSPPRSDEKELLWSSREQQLAKRAYERWRDRVLESRLLAEDEAKMRSMDPRRRRVLDVATWLAECQRAAQCYDYSGHSLAWEFLLKARYREDRENFFLSLKLEPPQST